jgi:hypothetical protein
MLCKKVNALAIITAIVSYSFICASELSPIDKKALFIPQRLGNISLHHGDKSGFVVKHSDSSNKIIQPHLMDKELRNISNNKLNKLVTAGAYLSVNKMSNSEDYSLKLQGRLNGGGPVGALVGAVVVKSAVHIAAQGIFFGIGSIVSFFATPIAGGAVYTGLTHALTPFVEALSVPLSVAGGIVGGVITGPV